MMTAEDSSAEMDLASARELVRSAIWPKVRDAFRASGKFAVYPPGDVRRLEYLDATTRAEIAAWVDGVKHIEEWSRVVMGKEVRALKAAHPGVYPEVLKFAPYFAGRTGDPTLRILKLKFPEAYKLCYC